MILRKFYLSLFEKIFFFFWNRKDDKAGPKAFQLVCKWDVIAAARIFVFA